jgi:hypothetical protein
VYSIGLVQIHTLKIIKMKKNKKIQSNHTEDKHRKSANENDDQEDLKIKKGDSDSELRADKHETRKTTKN